jgi:hypothetical protein
VKVRLLRQWRLPHDGAKYLHQQRRKRYRGDGYVGYFVSSANGASAVNGAMSSRVIYEITIP